MNRKKSSGKKAQERPAYLTKRLLISAAKRGIRKAAEESMAVMGYIVIAKGDWVVKKYADGTIEKITPIAKAHNAISLD